MSKTFGVKLFFVCLPFVLVILGVTYILSEQYYLHVIADENVTTHRLTQAGLQSELLRYEPIASLIADRDDVIELLSRPNNGRLADTLNEEFKQISHSTGASDIYLLDRNGEAIATSNFDQSYSFMNKTYEFRPYFIEASKGQNATFFALGTQSLKRGYYYSAPVFSPARNIIGVITVKVSVDSIEENWRGGHHDVLVIDKHGIVFMSTREDWRFKSINPLSDLAIKEINASRQYPIDQLGQLYAKFSSSPVTNTELLEMATSINRNQTSTRYITHQGNMPDAGWVLYVITKTDGSKTFALTVVLLTLLGLTLIGIIAGIIWYRRIQLLTSIELQQGIQHELEERVAERTAALRHANQSLVAEVEERTLAEKRLRETQRELVQAGKLAALGQMAASLSHEINQPLAAIRAYAVNANAFMDVGKIEQANDNIGHIETMAARMGKLIGHLKNFARKPKLTVSVVDLEAVFTAVETIVTSKLNNHNATLSIELGDKPHFVKGGLVRLQQVFVNLISNALDAMQGVDEPKIEVSVKSIQNGMVSIAFRDYGSGVDDEIVDKIFDPFFTTKDVNEGLGLGLSISYNIIQDFGGELEFEEHKDGGMIFTVNLQKGAEEQLVGE